MTNRCIDIRKVSRQEAADLLLAQYAELLDLAHRLAFVGDWDTAQTLMVAARSLKTAELLSRGER